MATNVSEFKNLIAVDVLPCPDPIVNREVMSVIIEFCRKTHILKRDFELDIDSSDINDERENSIDLDVSQFAQDLRPLFVIEFMIDGVRYDGFRRNIRNTSTHFENTESTGIKYFWIPDDNHIRVFDMSSNDSVIWMNTAFTYDRTATTVDNFLFDDWSEAIVCGTKFKILSMPGKEWSDARAAAHYEKMYKRYLSQAKRYAVKGGSGKDQGVNWKSFGELD